MAYYCGAESSSLMVRRQHNVVPEQSLVSEITHVALAFMQSSSFNRINPSDWPLFTTVEEVRSKFAPSTAVVVAVGGWGDTKGFSEAAVSDATRKRFAGNVKGMLEHTGADGVDVDWEYPGGNGEDYKQITNDQKKWEVEAYPKLLAEIRSAVGPEKLISTAVPGLTRDMMAFTKATVPQISASVDAVHVMTYDLMNRRDHRTKHHTGIALSLEAIDAYLENGLPLEKAHLGFAFYVKWFKTDPNGGCHEHPVGCKTVLMEDPSTGADLGGSGGFSWSDPVPPEVSTSFEKALANGVYDPHGGGHYYWDSEENIWWTWDSPDVIAQKFPAIVENRKLGGVFAWGLGEDGDKWDHLKALTAGVQNCSHLVGKHGSLRSQKKTEL